PDWRDSVGRADAPGRWIPSGSGDDRGRGERRGCDLSRNERHRRHARHARDGRLHQSGRRESRRELTTEAEDNDVPIRTVGVLGCGLMGSGIAQVSAASGYKTIVREVDQQFLDRGLKRIHKFLHDGVAKGKTTPEARDKTVANLSGTT